MMPASLAFPEPPSGPIGEGYLRFSVANSLENLNKALERIDGWTKKSEENRPAKATAATTRTPEDRL
jgi:hypothetical protein